jgi:hypothetical protein
MPPALADALSQTENADRDHILMRAAVILMFSFSPSASQKP